MPGKHILVVETDRDDAFLIGRALNTIPSCTSYICSSLEEAQAYLSHSGAYQDATKYPSADAIITEHRLGLHTAYDLLEWMRQQKNRLPLYILSDAVSPQDMNTMTHLGTAAIFEKPAGTAELKTTLADIAQKICSAN